MMGNGLVRIGKNHEDTAPLGRSDLMIGNPSGRRAALIWEAQAIRARTLIMRSQRIAARAVGLGLLTTLLASQSGCISGPTSWSAPSFSHLFEPREPLRNPLTVPSTNFDDVWNKTVVVVSKYFPIAMENRLAGVIRSESQMTGTIIEPWSSDSATFWDRFEATLQTYRKFALVHIEPAPTGGYLVRVEVMKELEDMVKPVSQPAGRAVFINDFPVNRTREIIGPVQAPYGWISQGRDTNMEQVILTGIRDALLL
jgi:hypothetical protein